MGAPNGLPIGLARMVASMDGDGDEKRSPSIFWSALQLAISPRTGDCGRCLGSYLSKDSNFGREGRCGFGCATTLSHDSADGMSMAIDAGRVRA